MWSVEEMKFEIRETACVLGLDVVFKHCPEKGTVFCKEPEERAGKVDLPYLVDV